MTYPLQFAAGALINTAGSGNDFVGGTNGYGNVQFNGLPVALQRLHRRWTGNQRSADQSEQRPLHQSGAGTEFHRGSHRQHGLLRGRSGPLRRLAGQLRHQVRHQSVSRKPVRVVERLEVQCRRFLHQRHRRKPQAALHREPLRRQPGRARSCATSCSSSSTPNGSGSRCPSSPPPPCPRRHFRTTSCSSFRAAEWIP